MHGACILQHLIMNTKHMQHVKSHRHTHTQALYPLSEVWLDFRFSCDICRECVILSAAANLSLCLNFKVKFLDAIQELSNTTIPGYRPVSARLLERRPLVGSRVWLRGRLLQQHPLGQSSTHVEGYNSPKVAGQTIVYATAHYCQVKGKRARQRINMKGSCLQLIDAFC